MDPSISYAEDLIDEQTPLVFRAGDPYLVDVISLELTQVDGAHPAIELRNPGGDNVPAGDFNMTVFRDAAGKMTGFSYIATKAGEYGITVTAEDGTIFRAAVRRGKALSFATNTAMYYIIVPLSVLLMLVGA